MADNPDFEHAMLVFSQNLDDPPLARDFAIRVLEEGGHHSAYQFLIEYYSPNGEEPNTLLVNHFKNLYDAFQL